MGSKHERRRSESPSGSSSGLSSARGTVKWFNGTKRFGFIRPQDGGGDLFVHITALPAGCSELSEGQSVAYDVGVSKGRTCAINVQVLGGH